MPDLQALEPANEPNYREARVFSLQSRKELDLFDLELLVSEARNSVARSSVSSFGVEQKTLLVLELNHFVDLPEGFAQTVAGRAYDYAASQGVHVRASAPRLCTTGILLPVKEME
jgi:hypothetical protein